MHLKSAALHILRLLDSHAGAVQAVSAAIVVVLTYLLVKHTKSYVKETNDALDISRTQLALLKQQVKDQEGSASLARDQFEQEWRPDLRIAEFRFDAQKHFKLVNLARSAALVTAVSIGRGGVDNIEPRDVVTYPMSYLIPAGGTLDDTKISGHLFHYARTRLPSSESTEWETAASIALIYDCAGKKTVTSEWFHCSLTTNQSQITKFVLR